MRVAFLDDSEQVSPLRAGLGPLLAFAAAIFPEESLAPFAADLSGIVRGGGRLRARLGAEPERGEQGLRPDGSAQAVMLALSPAVTANDAPLTIRASSDARNATTGATSAGSIQGTPSGLLAVSSCRAVSSS
jgi:hypothetical protein